jgi:ABC-type glycerol-3-phosphate transport system permease component
LTESRCTRPSEFQILTHIYIPLSKPVLATVALWSTVIITILPIICVYPFIQKYFTKGIMLGGVKE